MDVLLLAALAAFAAPLAVVHGAKAFVAGTAILAMLSSRVRMGTWFAIAIVASLSFARASREVSLGRTRAESALARFHGLARCVGTGVVRTSPVALAASSDPTLRFEVAPRSLACDDRPVHVVGDVAGEEEGSLLLVADDADIFRGDAVEFVADLAAPHRFANDDAGDARVRDARSTVVASGRAGFVVVTERSSGPRALVDRMRAHVRRRIRATFPSETAPMARALVLGEVTLDAQDQDAFRSSGLSHLLAVSGMHLVLAVGTVVRATRALLIRASRLGERFDVGRAAAAAGVVLAWIYANFAGASGSATRAAWMLSASYVAVVLGRRTSPVRAFALSVAAATLVDPWAVADVSLLLSVSATGGLLAFGSRFTAWIPDATPVVLRAPLRLLATTAAASAPSAPVIATLGGGVPVAGLVANVFAIPVGELASLPLCLVHSVASPIPVVENVAARTASGSLLVLRAVARAFASLPWATGSLPPPTPWEWTVMVVAASAWALLVPASPVSPVTPFASSFAGRVFRGAGVAGAFAIAEGWARHEGSPRGELRVTFLDVGQGDAAIVDLPDGTAVLVDAGGLVGSPVDTGVRVVIPVLRARRRSRLRAVILSHPHPDHFSGFARLLDAIDVDAIWDTGQGVRDGVGGVYRAWREGAASRGIPVLGPSDLCGTRELGRATLDVVAPCPGPVEGRGANDNSFVFRWTFGSRSVLFTGDAEGIAEASMLADPAVTTRLRSDVLKVGHHGSRSSSTAPFVDAVGPSVALASTGVRNRFGHPHPSTLATFAAAGVDLLRTDRDGNVVVSTDGTALHVRRSRAALGMY
ncbi:MAG: DNA internalization-related competence protein ComEC/Rec2 [Polyangiaceae bacterium]